MLSVHMEKTIKSIYRKNVAQHDFKGGLQLNENRASKEEELRKGDEVIDKQRPQRQKGLKVHKNKQVWVWSVLGQDATQEPIKKTHEDRSYAELGGPKSTENNRLTRVTQLHVGFSQLNSMSLKIKSIYINNSVSVRFLPLYVKTAGWISSKSEGYVFCLDFQANFLIWQEQY